MENSHNHVKINSYLTKGWTPNWQTNNQEFRERLYEYNEMFRSKLLIELNERVGLHNWAIKFVEHPTDKPIFFSDIYLEDPSFYPYVANFVSSNIPEIEFHPYFKGNITNYKFTD